MHDAFHAARDAAGRPDLRFHDLRHTGATLAAAAGATVAELMARIGHTTPAMADALPARHRRPGPGHRRRPIRCSTTPTSSSCARGGTC